MEIETVFVPVGDLLSYENNAKIHTEKQIEHIMASITDFGFNDPVGVWTREDGRVEIVTGHGAVEAARRLGIEQVPCNFLDHLTDEQRRAYCHVHNQTQLETGLDYDALTADMDNLNANWDNYGFEQYSFSYIDDLMNEDFAKNATEKDGETFNITFTFPSVHRTQIEAYVKDVGKQTIVDEIIDKAVF